MMGKNQLVAAKALSSLAISGTIKIQQTSSVCLLKNGPWLKATPE